MTDDTAPAPKAAEATTARAAWASPVLRRLATSAAETGGGVMTDAPEQTS